MSVERCREVLGVTSAASAVEIKQSHRDLVKVWHPDRFADEPRLAAKASEMLKIVNEAYETLAGRASIASDAAPAWSMDPLVDFLNDLRART